MSSTELPLPSVSAGGSSSYFGSTLVDIESYFDLPPSDPKDSEVAAGATAAVPTTSAESAQFHSLKTPCSSPTLNPVKPHLRQSPGMWGDDGGGDASTIEALAASYPPTLAGLNATTDDVFSGSSVAPLQISNSYMGQLSPPDSSGSSPDKAAPPGDISPLDGFIATTRTVHGQVTPPDDYAKSPGLPTHLPTALVLPMGLGSPSGTPKSSPHNMSNRLSISEESKCMMGFGDNGMGGSNKRRRSSAGPSGRKSRKSPSADEDPEVQEAKRRRFLERNRVAASKCRQKKKAWMQDLEAEARDAQQMSKQLKMCVGILKEEILQIKNELLKHNTCDCHPIRQYLSNEAARLAGADAGGRRGSNNLTGSDIAFPTDVSGVPDSKIHPALHAPSTLHSIQPDFDLGYIDSTIDGAG